MPRVDVAYRRRPGSGAHNRPLRLAPLVTIEVPDPHAGRGLARARRFVAVVIAVECGGIGASLVRRHGIAPVVVMGLGLVGALFWAASRVQPGTLFERSLDATDDPGVGDDRAAVSSIVSDDQVLRSVGESLTSALVGSEVHARPMAAHVGGGLVELFWSDRPPRPREPWVSALSGWVWNARRSALETMRSVDHSVDDALPACVQVGTTRRGALALNLESFDTIALTGDEDERVALASRLMSELRDRGVEVLYIADAPDSSVMGAAGTPAAGNPTAVDAAVARAGECRREREPLLGERAWPSAFVARIHDPEPERWRPLVLFCDLVTGVDELWELGSAAHAITCVAVHGLTDAGLELEARGGMVRVPFLGAIEIRAGEAEPPVEPGGVGESGTVGGLVAGPVDETVPNALESAVDAVELAEDPGEGEAEGVEVCVLGPVEVRGASGVGGLTAKSIELIAYLAFSPGGAADDRIQSALWPDRAPSPKTWRNRVWSARQALGNGPDGRPVLPHVEGRVGRLGAGVRTDVDTLVDALAASSDMKPSEAIAVLRTALGRVRGRPFEEANGYEWAFADMHVTHAECVVADVAHRLVELALEAGDPGLALWATDRALRCCPANEPLSLDRMRAFHAAGDLAGVETTMRDLLASLEADEPEDVLHDDTIAAYHALLPERSGPRDRRRPHPDTTT